MSAGLFGNDQNLNLKIITQDPFDMKVPMEMALSVARENLREVRTVTEWAEKMGYENPKYFSRKFRRSFGKRPKSKLIEIRVEKFLFLILNESEKGCYEIALEIGFKDEITLSKFIKRHTGFAPTVWREKMKFMP